MVRSIDELKRNVFPGESGGDYDALFGFSNRQGGRFAGVKPTQMTINQVLAFTDPSGPYAQWVKGQVGRVATPVGGFQVVGSTLRDTVQRMGLSGNELFDPAMQDAIGMEIYKAQGPGAWEGWGKGGGNVAVSTSGGQPMGLLDFNMQPQQPMTFGERLRSPETMDGILTWLNSMRMNPDPGINQMVQARAQRRSEEAKRNRTAEVLAQISPQAAELVRSGFLSPSEALGVYRDQRAQDLAAQASEALARGDYQTAYSLSLQISPTAAGQAIAQQFGPRQAEVTGGGMYTVTYENGQPKITVNSEVQQAELARMQAEADLRRETTTRQPPAAVVKAEEEDFAAIDTIDQLTPEIGGVLKMFGRTKTGEFKGPLRIGVGGAIQSGLGYLGMGEENEQTRLARAAYDRFVTRYINESLRLNAGVQTEGDAQRAVAELGNANSTEAAYDALIELVEINQRARLMKERAISGRRERYGLDPAAVPPSVEIPGIGQLSPEAQRYLESN
jgi:hypothetical protein